MLVVLSASPFCNKRFDMCLFVACSLPVARCCTINICILQEHVVPDQGSADVALNVVVLGGFRVKVSLGDGAVPLIHIFKILFMLLAKFGVEFLLRLSRDNPLRRVQYSRRYV